VYQAFVSAEALEQWQAPELMTATVHEIDVREGGGYRMTLTYPPAIEGSPGKTTDREDRYTARFVELTPPSRIVEAINFDTVDPDFSGEMTISVDLTEVDGGTDVTMSFANIPAGIRPEDNDAGTRSSLEKLARLVEDNASS
jgi:uncharacterized protein YndB with AHSA1/START domain